MYLKECFKETWNTYRSHSSDVHVPERESMGESCDGNVLGQYNVGVVVVTLYYSFARCYHCGNWIKATWDIFLTTVCNCIIIKNFH